MNILDYQNALNFLTARNSFLIEEAISVTHGYKYLYNALQWIKQPAIQGVGISYRTTDGVTTNDLALKVYVDSKRPLSKTVLPIPQIINIPGLDEAIPVDVEAIGQLSPQSNSLDNIRGGHGIYNKEVRELGTLGCLLQNKANPDKRYLLSNAHVLAKSPAISQGDPILYRSDRGDEDELIAHLTTWSDVNLPLGTPAKVDAAIAEIIPGKVDPSIQVVGGLATGSTGMVFRGTQIKIYGAGSNIQQTSRVVDPFFRVPRDIPEGHRNVRTPFDLDFIDQVMCKPAYSAIGDSGSIICNEDDQIIGLHFMGSNEIGIFNRIKNVLDEFKRQGYDLELVTEKTINNTRLRLYTPEKDSGGPFDGNGQV